ncbi:MAG: outer membrane lipoprotein carrier protein LolA [Thiothrix sp.]|nr:MAG: outer membrane lipoprotein carrier protein LolA [Thiothrix sp.]
MIMMLYKILRIILFLSATSVQADSGSERLNHFMQNVKTLDTAFTQEVMSEDGEITQASQGRFMLSRPGKFRWEYQKPTPQEIISDGMSLWIYDKELEQVTVKPLSEVIGSSPAAILMQQSDLSKDYQILDQSSQEGLDWVALNPLDKNGDFIQILIGLNAKGIQAMDLHDQFGQITKIRFQQSEFNTSINGENFKFTPPVGVDVIGQPAT